MSDLFGTSGIRGPVGERVTADTALAVGHALAATGYERVVVGRDARTTGRALADTLVAGAREAGTDVVRLGVAATPTVARAVRPLDADCGVVVTASHNPPTDNGFKFWSPDGSAFDASERDRVADALDRGVRERVGSAAFGDVRHLPAFDESPAVAARGGRTTGPSGGLDGSPDPSDTARPTASHTARSNTPHAARPTAHHVERLVRAVDGPVASAVVVDVGNGVGSVTAAALERLGCTVRTVDERPDGRFPGRQSEPTSEACAALSATVAGTDAAFGVAHDGDADRAQFVASDGTYVGGDATLALFARDACATGDRVAVPVDASLAVEDAVSEVGASVTRTPVGDTFVAAACAADDRVAFGGEASGAWIWPDETLAPDGPLAACRMAALVARDGSLGERVAELPSYPIRRDAIEVPEERKSTVMDAVRERVYEAYDESRVTTLDGVRVETDDGWFLVRPSGTQPLVRVTAEARDAGRADELLADGRDLIETAS